MLIKVHVFPNCDEPFCALLDQHGVEYRKHDGPPSGIVRMSADYIEIISAIANASPWGAIALVLIAWIKSRSTRKVMIIKTNKRSETTFENMSTKEIVEILQQSQSIAVIDEAAYAEIPPNLTQEL